MIKLLLSLLLGIASSSPAATRIGGGKIYSDTSMASFDIDDSFPFRTETQEQGAILNSFTGASGRLNRETIWVDEILLDHPNIGSLTQDQVRDLFENTYDYTAIFHSDACVVGFYKYSQNTHTFVLTWGKGRGFKLVGTEADFTRRAILRMVRTVKLEPGACSWN